MEMNHTREQMAAAFRAAANAILPKDARLGEVEAQMEVDTYLNASPFPVTTDATLSKLLAGVIKALR